MRPCFVCTSTSGKPSPSASPAPRPATSVSPSVAPQPGSGTVDSWQNASTRSFVCTMSVGSFWAQSVALLGPDPPRTSHKKSGANLEPAGATDQRVSSPRSPKPRTTTSPDALPTATSPVNTPPPVFTPYVHAARLPVTPPG